MNGLKYIPDLGNLNDVDNPPVNILVKPTFSEKDMDVLLRTFDSIKEWCRTILEIGIGVYAPDHSSSHQLIRQKRDGCAYIGVDIENRQGLRNFDYKNIFVLDNMNSSEFDKISRFVYHINGNRPVDFLHIDGYHSVNQILKDWKFAELLADNGIIVLHDTNYHYGPVELLKALDEKIWSIEQFFKDDPADWGITVVKKYHDSHLA